MGERVEASTAAHFFQSARRVNHHENLVAAGSGTSGGVTVDNIGRGGTEVDNSNCRPRPLLPLRLRAPVTQNATGMTIPADGVRGRGKAGNWTLPQVSLIVRSMRFLLDHCLAKALRGRKERRRATETWWLS